MNQGIKKILMVLLFSTIQCLCYAGIIAIGSFNKGRGDTVKVENTIKQVIVFSNQKITRNTTLNNISMDQNPDLVVSPFVKYEVTQDTLLERYNRVPQSKMVVFKVSPKAFLKVTKNGSMIFNNRTLLHLSTNSTLEISDSSILYIRNSSALQIDSGARVIVRGSGKIVCEDSSNIYVNPYAYIILQHKKSTIDMGNGSKIIPFEGMNISYLGSGHIYIDRKEYYKIKAK